MFGIYNVYAQNADGSQAVLARRDGAAIVITPLLGMSGSNEGTIDDLAAFGTKGAALKSRVDAESGSDHTEPLKANPHGNQDLQRLEYSAQNTDEGTGAVTSEAQIEIYFSPGTNDKAVMEPETFDNLLAAIALLPAA